MWRVDSKGIEKVRWEEAATAVHMGDGGDLGQGGSRGGGKWMHLSETVAPLTCPLMDRLGCGEGQEDSRWLSVRLWLFKLWMKGNLRG